MKISNETKVGALAAIGITILILGYNFLQGEKLFSSDRTYYAIYTAVSGLSSADDVIIRGYEIGKVSSIDLKKDSIITIIVGFTINEDIAIPEDSEARIVSSDLLGAKSLELILGTSTIMAQDGDTIRGDIEPSIQQAITVELLPVKNKFEELIKNLDSVITTIQSTFDTRFQENIDENMVSIREALINLRTTSERLDRVVENQSGRIDNIMANLESITYNLDQNEPQINAIFQNLANISDSLSRVQFTQTMAKVDRAITDLAEFAEKVNKGEGNAALLVNDNQVYENLNDASRSLELLILDIRQNPRRYLPPLIRVGGGKNNNEPTPPQE